jgi:hypothetical protein
VFLFFLASYESNLASKSVIASTTAEWAAYIRDRNTCQMCPWISGVEDTGNK